MSTRSGRPAVMRSEADNTPDTTEGSILIVEDDRARRYVAGRVLRANGFEVVECGTAVDGLRLARTRHPDLLLLDVLLPDLDGRDMCRALKADPATADIVVLHLS